jgi:hypothetical protein
VLKMLSPKAAALTLRVHGFFSRRDIAFPKILWAAAQDGAILYEDCGTLVVPVSPNERELSRIFQYLSKLHDVGSMTEQTARIEFPELSSSGFPTKAQLAAAVVRRYVALAPARSEEIFEAAVAAVEGMPSTPFLAISDIKREHFLLRDGQPILVDLEMASFWELPAANLATLLSFPGQFTSALEVDLKRRLVDEYVESRQTERIDAEALWRAVKACEFLLSLTLSRAVEHCRTQPGYMIRNRRLETGADGRNSVEAEVGPTNFQLLCDRLNSGDAIDILDLAAGTGEAMRDISQRWPQHRLTSLDLYPTAGTPGAVAGDAQCMPFATDIFDVILCVQLLQYIPDKLALIGAVYRALRPGGLAVFAMTEHFGRESGIVPGVSELARVIQPAQALMNVDTHPVGERAVTTFCMVRQTGDLIFPCQFEAAVALRTAGSIDCYYQSRYFPPRFPVEATTPHC